MSTEEDWTLDLCCQALQGHTGNLRSGFGHCLQDTLKHPQTLFLPLQDSKLSYAVGRVWNNIVERVPQLRRSSVFAALREKQPQAHTLLEILRQKFSRCVPLSITICPYLMAATSPSASSTMAEQHQENDKSTIVQPPRSHPLPEVSPPFRGFFLPTLRSLTQVRFDTFSDRHQCTQNLAQGTQNPALFAGTSFFGVRVGICNALVRMSLTRLWYDQLWPIWHTLFYDLS